ncbi:MAG: SagB/ThcOx family dehydrogenase, partial [Thermodesulfobacteriota bacterium]
QHSEQSTCPHWGRVLSLITLMFILFALQEVFMAGGLFASSKGEVQLPAYKSGDSELAELLYKRRSVRSFAQGSLSLQEVSRALFSAQGQTRGDRFRTVPSAGALYPLELYLVAENVQDLEPGVYKYLPEGHALQQVRGGERLQELAKASLGQMWISQAQAAVVITAVFERVTGKYGSRGEQYVHMEAGCAAQSLSLQVAELGLGTTVVGAFRDNQVREVLGAKKQEVPLLVMPLGRVQE